MLPTGLIWTGDAAPKSISSAAHTRAARHWSTGHGIHQDCPQTGRGSPDRRRCEAPSCRRRAGYWASAARTRWGRCWALRAGRCPRGRRAARSRWAPAAPLALRGAQVRVSLYRLHGGLFKACASSASTAKTHASVLARPCCATPPCISLLVLIVLLDLKPHVHSCTYAMDQSCAAWDQQWQLGVVALRRGRRHDRPSSWLPTLAWASPQLLACNKASSSNFVLAGHKKSLPSF